MNIQRRSEQIKSNIVATGYNLLSCGTATLSIIVPGVDSFLAIGYQVSRVFNIFYIYDYNPHNYRIVKIILTRGNNIQELLSNSLLSLVGRTKIEETVKESAKKVGQTFVIKGTEKTTENVAIKTTQTVVEKTAEQVVIQTSKKIIEQNIIQGAKVLANGLLKETTKLGAITASKEGIEKVAI